MSSASSTTDTMKRCRKRSRSPASLATDDVIVLCGVAGVVGCKKSQKPCTATVMTCEGKLRISHPAIADAYIDVYIPESLLEMFLLSTFFDVDGNFVNSGNRFLFSNNISGLIYKHTGEVFLFDEKHPEFFIHVCLVKN